MAATASTAFFSVSPASDASSGKPGGNVGGLPASVDARGIRSKSVSSKTLQVKASAQAPTKVNGSRVGVMEGLKSDDQISSSPPPRTFINQLPDWSMLLAAITTIFLAAEKQWTVVDWKPKRLDMLGDPFGLGRIVHDGLAFRQNFSIRSYEIGADRTASVETLMNHLQVGLYITTFMLITCDLKFGAVSINFLPRIHVIASTSFYLLWQDTALNHVKQAGLLGDGFGSTPEMCKKNLIWVVTKMQVMFDRYPTW